MDLFGFLVVILAWGIPALVVSLILYWIIRLGVKHGLRSYYSAISA